MEDRHDFTSAKATARFLAQEKSGRTAFGIGKRGLVTALHENGAAAMDDEPDQVIVGEVAPSTSNWRKQRRA